MPQSLACDESGCWVQCFSKMGFGSFMTVSQSPSVSPKSKNMLSYCVSPPWGSKQLDVPCAALQVVARIIACATISHIAQPMLLNRSSTAGRSADSEVPKHATLTKSFLPKLAWSWRNQSNSKFGLSVLTAWQSLVLFYFNLFHILLTYLLYLELPTTTGCILWKLIIFQL